MAIDSIGNRNPCESCHPPTQQILRATNVCRKELANDRELSKARLERMPNRCTESLSKKTQASEHPCFSLFAAVLANHTRVGASSLCKDYARKDVQLSSGLVALEVLTKFDSSFQARPSHRGSGTLRCSMFMQAEFTAPGIVASLSFACVCLQMDSSQNNGRSLLCAANQRGCL